MAELYMLTEHSLFMMSFVFITDKDNAVVIDGGNPEDMPHLKEIVGDRRIIAWILTHPHFDHISGFVKEAETTDIMDKVDRIYCNFPSEKFVIENEPDIKPCSITDFNRILPLIQHKCTIVYPGFEIYLDELRVEFLFCGEERYDKLDKSLAVNESSIVFKITSPSMRSVLFLGDLGPCGGRDLLKSCEDKLKSDIVQMSHHGHSGVTEEVYRAISPEACMWCAPEWLWEEEDIEFAPDSYGTKRQRKWMDALGVKEHYVTKDGTLKIKLRKE